MNSVGTPHPANGTLKPSVGLCVFVLLCPHALVILQYVWKCLSLSVHEGALKLLYTHGPPTQVFSLILPDWTSMRAWPGCEFSVSCVRMEQMKPFSPPPSTSCSCVTFRLYRSSNARKNFTTGASSCSPFSSRHIFNAVKSCFVNRFMFCSILETCLQLLCDQCGTRYLVILCFNDHTHHSIHEGFYQIFWA